MEENSIHSHNEIFNRHWQKSLPLPTSNGGQFPRAQTCSLANMYNHQRERSVWGGWWEWRSMSRSRRGRFSSFKWQVAASCHPLPSTPGHLLHPTFLPSFSSTFPITSFPRGGIQSWLLLLITHGPKKRSSCWTSAEQEQQWRSLGVKRSLIKSFKLPWKTKDGEFRSFGGKISQI